MLLRQFESTDAEIDRLVYELYSLTEVEIRIVEDATKRLAFGERDPKWKAMIDN
jgi:hypothetical protein